MGLPINVRGVAVSDGDFCYPHPNPVLVGFFRDGVILTRSPEICDRFIVGLNWHLQAANL